MADKETENQEKYFKRADLKVEKVLNKYQISQL
jgi:hypothetical protein